jgi:Lysophospholipase L1 and related esterases
MRRIGLFGLALVVAAGAEAAPAAKQPHWVASWATSQMIADGANALAPDQLTDSTLRQQIRLSLGGKSFRLTLSNAFGKEPLHLKAVHVAKPGGTPGAIDVKTDHALTFSGHDDVTIPAGASYTSDPVDMAAAPLSDLVISIHYDAPPSVQTSHPGSRQTSFVVAGDHVSDGELVGAKTMEHWYQIDSIDVVADAKAGAVVALGDSITDGRGSTTNGNDRWTNMMAAALQGDAKTRHLGVLNSGIGGNCVLVQCLGPNALSRLEREVFSPAGVSALIVYEGVNDLGRVTREHAIPPEEHKKLVDGLIAGYTQIASRAHTHGLKVYIATILPYGNNAYYHPDAQNEANRTAINTWIRTQKLFDGVIDFDAAVRDPSHPTQLLPVYDSGDGLHASAAGYKVMGSLAAKVLGAKGEK